MGARRRGRSGVRGVRGGGGEDWLTGVRRLGSPGNHSCTRNFCEGHEVNTDNPRRF